MNHYSEEEKELSWTEACISKPRRNQFLSSLYSALEDSELEPAISWDITGTLIELRDPNLISKRVLPKHFFGMKFSSFIRQLNYYGFKRASRRAKMKVYFNEQFRRGRKDLINKIKRNHKELATEESFEEKSSHIEHKDSEMSQMDILQKKIKTLQTELDDLKSENSALKSLVIKLTGSTHRPENYFQNTQMAKTRPVNPYRGYHTYYKPNYDESYYENLPVVPSPSQQSTDSFMKLSRPNFKYPQAATYVFETDNPGFIGNEDIGSRPNLLSRGDESFSDCYQSRMTNDDDLFWRPDLCEAENI